MKLKLKKETNNFVAKDIDSSVWGKSQTQIRKLGFLGDFPRKQGNPGKIEMGFLVLRPKF